MDNSKNWETLKAYLPTEIENEEALGFLIIGGLIVLSFLIAAIFSTVNVLTYLLLLVGIAISLVGTAKIMVYLEELPPSALIEISDKTWSESAKNILVSALNKRNGKILGKDLSKALEVQKDYEIEIEEKLLKEKAEVAIKKFVSK